MCGRYTLAIEYQELALELGVEPDPVIAEAYRPRYNIAPTDGNLVLRVAPAAPPEAASCAPRSHRQPAPQGHEERAPQGLKEPSIQGHRELMPARFGLVNFWAKDLSAAARQINARAETVREKPAFREAFERRRCVVPADGFYEWQREGRAKTAFWFHPTDEKVLRFAGLYETWKDKATGAHVRTFAILTTAANDVVGKIHDRMPAILTRETMEIWLTGTSDQAFSLLGPAPARALSVQRASSRVGNVRNDDPGLLHEEAPVEVEMPLFQRSR